jgi:hypothetical protein
MISNWEKEMQDFHKSQEESSNLGADSHYLEDREIVKSVMQDNLDSNYNREDFLKGFGADLEKRFPNGSWKTVGGSKVFINGGKVVAGLDGFNKEIDKFFEGKKAKQSSSKSKEDAQHKTELDNYKKATGEKKERMRKILESNAKMDDSKLNDEQKKIKQRSIKMLQQSPSKGSEKKQESKKDIGVGLEYITGRGENMKVVGTKKVGGDNYFEVIDTSKEKPLKDLMTKEDIESELKFAEKQLPQKQEREKQDKIQEQKDVDAKKEFDNIDGFGNNLSSMALGKVKQDLNKKVNLQGKGQMTRKEYIKDKLKDGYEVKTNTAGQRVLMAKDGAWIGNKNLVNKTALDYAEHLSKNKPKADSKKEVKNKRDDIYARLDKYKDTGMYKTTEERDRHAAEYKKAQQELSELNKQEDKKTDKKSETVVKNKDEFKPDKKTATNQNKLSKDIDTWSKKYLDPEKTESLQELKKYASKIDDKFISKKTKDKISKLMDQVELDYYGGNSGEVVGTKSLTGQLQDLIVINKYLSKKEDSYTLEEESLSEIRDVIIDALKEQINKKTTEALNYKLF